MVFGAGGRFSEDLDFACLVLDAELAQLELLELLENDALEDDVTVRQAEAEVAGPGTLQARFTFTSPIGDGRFELDVTSAGRPVLLGTTLKRMATQPYFAQLGFVLPEILMVRSVEMAAEKLAAIHRRFENGNPKDVWDLWKWFRQSHPDEVALVRQLWPARLWLDGATEPVRWRGPGWIEQLDVRRFNWDRLRPLLPATQRLEPGEIVTELKSRLRPWVDEEPDGVLSDVGDGRQRARHAVETRIEAVKATVTNG